jgi:hypothetical protein
LHVEFRLAKPSLAKLNMRLQSKAG